MSADVNVTNFVNALGEMPAGTPRVVIGYGVDYAVYVHEILTNKHPQGQAKFLEAALNNAIGSQMLQKAITLKTQNAKTLDELYQGIAQAVEITALQILGDSQQLCPILTGALAASANWQGEDGPGSGENPNGVTVIGGKASSRRASRSKTKKGKP
jgi:hypothetical protein